MSNHDYFTKAQSWEDEFQSSMISSRKRYQVAFIGMSVLVGLLICLFCIVLPLKETKLVVVHEGQSGYNWVSLAKVGADVAPNWQRTQSEIANYVTERESYDPLLYQYQSREVAEKSSEEVLAEYSLSQDKDHTLAPINFLAAKGYRTVTVNSVLMIDSEDKNNEADKGHKNVAQVSFIVKDHYFDQRRTIKTPYVALISWKYNGVPQTPSEQFDNWDGFMVTDYRLQAVNTGN